MERKYFISRIGDYWYLDYRVDGKYYYAGVTSHPRYLIEKGSELLPPLTIEAEFISTLRALLLVGEL